MILFFISRQKQTRLNSSLKSKNSNIQCVELYWLEKYWCYLLFLSHLIFYGNKIHYHTACNYTVRIVQYYVSTSLFYFFSFLFCCYFLLLFLFIVIVLSFSCCNIEISPFAGQIKEIWFWFCFWKHNLEIKKKNTKLQDLLW